MNSLVGNPVNLIDVNNEVGREYMNALLDAMKKTLGSSPAQEVERAMARLERAFVEVKAALAAMGMMSEEVRLPLVPLSDKSRAVLNQSLKACGVIKK